MLCKSDESEDWENPPHYHDEWANKDKMMFYTFFSLLNLNFGAKNDSKNSSHITMNILKVFCDIICQNIEKTSDIISLKWVWKKSFEVQSDLKWISSFGCPFLTSDQSYEVSSWTPALFWSSFCSTKIPWGTKVVGGQSKPKMYTLKK